MTNWFSAKVRLVCLVESGGATRYMDSVHVFKATDFDDAHTRALELGREHEEEYTNIDKQLVRWRLKEIISLDLIPSDSLDGAEVYSEPVEIDSEEEIPFEIEFHPERSTPTQTI